MPKNEIQDSKENAVNKQKTAQNLSKPAKDVKLKAKTKKTEIAQVSIEQPQEDEIQNKSEAKQNDAKIHKQSSRSAILFVSAMNYLVFFFGFCACRNEPFARFHQNQALWMWIIITILYLSFAFIPGVNKVAIPFVIMLHILWVIAGVCSALRGRAYSVPLVGKIKIVDWEKV